MRIYIIVIGDELLLGQVTDSNSGFLARAVAPASWQVVGVETVGDDAEAMLSAISRGMQCADIVLTTGGLGPTKDDITKQVLCNYFGGSLHLDADVLANVEQVMRRRSREINELTRSQAMVPDTCRVIQNRVGTAPIMWFEREGSVLVAMPGVPFETEEMFTTEVFPQLLKRFAGNNTVLHHRSLMVTGMSESALAEKLAPVEDALPQHLHLAYLPHPGYIHLRIDGTGIDADNLDGDIDLAVKAIESTVGDAVIAHDAITPARLLLTLLNECKLTVATAESCTGGNIAHEITLIPGSSSAMLGGVVSYSNSVKMGLLGVKAEMLEAHGAVSIPVVEQMALGVCRATGANVGIATSGIAGPGGATPGKPVGTVCIAVAVNGIVTSATHHFPGNRTRVINHATTTALLAAARRLGKS